MSAEGGVEVSAPSSWDEVGAAGLDTTTIEPLRAWRLQYAGDDAAFDLELEATGTLAELDPDHDVARAGGMAGYEQPRARDRQRHRAATRASPSTASGSAGTPGARPTGIASSSRARSRRGWATTSPCR